jgi:hypothetical protein
MTPSHTIKVYPETRLLHLKLSGFFDEPAIKRFIADREAAYAKLGNSGDHVTLCDVSECKIQSRDSFERFRGLLMEQRRWGKRMAFVVPKGSLAGLQVSRLVAQRPDLRVFNEGHAAMAWLNSSNDCQAAA